MRLFYNKKFLLILGIALTYFGECNASCVGPNWTFYEYSNNRNKNEMLIYGQVVKYEKIDSQYLVCFSILEWFSDNKNLKQIEILMPLTSCEINVKWIIRPYWNKCIKRYQAGNDCDQITIQETAYSPDIKEIQNKLSTLRMISQIDRNKLDTTVVFTNYNNEIVAKGEYKNGLKNGAWDYYINNKLKSRYTYNKGKCIDKREYDSNEYPRLYRNEKNNYQLNYSATDSSAIMTEYVSFGRKKTQKNRLGNFYKSKTKITNYYASGKISDISFQLSYRAKGGLNGYVYKTIEYYESGGIKSIKKFKHDRQAGIWKYYNEFGELERKEIWSIRLLVSRGWSFHQ